ncbi:hypothetical protein C5167_046042 [Papaver somniferum]|uniref:Uncharacterized protein n=1 Tax=Papaver somniferum TaxID=3469 RepID=A0A4Y7LEY0_PAPSO|nr:hypothetical protein C5167_046042 [Papaver somniferum]
MELTIEDNNMAKDALALIDHLVTLLRAPHVPGAINYFMEFLMWSFILHPSDDLKILTISSYLIYDIGHAKLAGDIAIGPLMEEKVEVEDTVGDEEGTKEIAPWKMKVQFSCRCILERK